MKLLILAGIALSVHAHTVTHVCRIIGWVTGGQTPNSAIVIHISTTCDGPHAPTITKRIGTVTASTRVGTQHRR